MIIDKLIEKKDLLNLLKLRKEHLILEMKKVPFTTEEKLRERVIRKLSAKVQELIHLIKIVNENKVKSTSKYEFNKIEQLRR